MKGVYEPKTIKSVMGRPHQNFILVFLTLSALSCLLDSIKTVRPGLVNAFHI